MNCFVVDAKRLEGLAGVMREQLAVTDAIGESPWIGLVASCAGQRETP
jgi:hypothetical protein